MSSNVSAPGPPAMNTTGSAAGFAASAGMTATGSSMVRLPGRERFSGTSRTPQRAPFSASIGSGGSGQAPGTNRGAAVSVGPVPADGAREDAALLEVPPNAARQTRAAAAAAALVLCFAMCSRSCADACGRPAGRRRSGLVERTSSKVAAGTKPRIW